MQKREQSQTESGVSATASAGRPVLVATSLALIIAVLLGGIYFARRSGSDPSIYSNDFNVYYHASQEVCAGRDPYQHSLSEWTPYLYPPLLAELIVPLALLPLPLAAYLWFLINAGSIVAAAWMSARLVRESREAIAPRVRIPRSIIAGLALIIVFRFVLDNFDLGQVNAMMAALAAAHIYLYVRGQKALSAIALVLAVSIKLTPAVFLVYHLAKMRLKFSAACLALLAAVTVTSFLLMGASGPDAFRAFARRTLTNEQGYNLADAGNQSLRGSVARLTARLNGEVDAGGSRKLADGLTVVLSVVLIGVAAFGAVRSRDEVTAVAPFFCCMVLLSPLSWKAHFVALIVPLANLVALDLSSGNWRRLFIAAVLAPAFALFNLTSPNVIGLAAAEWADAHSLVFAGALLVLVASLVVSMMHKFGKQSRVC